MILFYKIVNIFDKYMNPWVSKCALINNTVINTRTIILKIQCANDLCIPFIVVIINISKNKRPLWVLEVLYLIFQTQNLYFMDSKMKWGEKKKILSELSTFTFPVSLLIFLLTLLFS